MNERIKTLHLQFRPDINGLRAVAVILVLLFHLEYSSVQAGFLGVDVFLVISGYLITRNILSDLKYNSFSFSSFYIKRFKRLFPALFVTLGLSLAAGFVTLTPANFEQLSKSVISGVFFFSNLFFLNESGYFNTESAFKPLLHVWSLSLEEQFYFVWPLLLLLMFRVMRKGIFLFILLLIILTMVAAESYVLTKPDAVFFLLPFRFFEFLLGALCIWLERFQIKNKVISELCTSSGLTLICFSVMYFSELTPMPGILSLVPCAGAMLVIYGGNTKYSGWLLRNKISELLGRASYSIYLVHWPLIVYYKFYTLLELTPKTKIAFGFLSIILGLLMWKFVENTVRRSTLKVRQIDAAWIWMPVLMLTISWLSWNVIKNEGFPSRYSAEFTMTEEELTQTRNRYWEGPESDKAILKGSSTNSVIVMGNSFSIDLIYALRLNGLQENIVSLHTSHRCYNFAATAINSIDTTYCNTLKNHNLTNSAWKAAKAIYLFDHWYAENLSDLRSILYQIRAHTNAPIYVFGPKIVFSQVIPEIVRACNSASPLAINRFAQEHSQLEDRSKLNDTLINFFKDSTWKTSRINYINVLAILKNDQQQFEIVSRNTSEFLYFDRSHFTEQGAKEFGQKLKIAKPEIFYP